MVHSLKRSKSARRKSISDQIMISMEPLVEGGRLPLVIRPVVDGVELASWCSGHRQELTDLLHRHGGILFRGFGLNQPEQMTHLIGVISGKTLEYRERSSPRHRVSGNIYTSTDYPADREIFFHNENSYQFGWPQKIFFQCLTPASTGGRTPIADSRNVLAFIDPDVLGRFRKLGVRYVRNFYNDMGLPWQRTFCTEDRAEVEAYCKRNGLTPTWKENDGLRTECTRAAMVRHPHDGEALWFNHAAFFHNSTLEPDLRETLCSSMEQADLPANTYYGDGSPIEDGVAEHLREAYRKASVSFDWERGDVLMLDNMLASHSRTTFRGERRILVGMAEFMDRNEAEEVMD